jgi:ubiquinone/menaquinone biosynthesis C-methylase UbiE
VNDASAEIPVNHHGDHPGFAGITGSLCGFLFLLIGRANARLATERARVSATDHVVDVGCGPGTAARTAARRGARVTGVDPSASMLRVARAVTRGRADITWAEGTAEDLPVPDGSATVVWALATVHHWRDVTEGLAQAYRALAPGGRLLAVERRTDQGATGLASHGWTDAQAESFAGLCRTAGLVDVAVRSDRAGRRAVWTVSGRRPDL